MIPWFFLIIASIYIARAMPEREAVIFGFTLLLMSVILFVADIAK